MGLIGYISPGLRTTNSLVRYLFSGENSEIVMALHKSRQRGLVIFPLAGSSPYILEISKIIQQRDYDTFLLNKGGGRGTASLKIPSHKNIIVFPTTIPGLLFSLVYRKRNTVIVDDIFFDNNKSFMVRLMKYRFISKNMIYIQNIGRGKFQITVNGANYKLNLEERGLYNNVDLYFWSPGLLSFPDFMKCQKYVFENSNDYYKNNYFFQERLYWEPTIDWISQVNAQTVVDIGAGYGTLLNYIVKTKNPTKKFIIDPFEIASGTVLSKLRLEYLKYNIETQDVPCENIDLIIMTEVIEHFNYNPVPTMLKIKDMLSKDGKLIISTPDSNSKWGKIRGFYGSWETMPVYRGQNIGYRDGHIWQYSKSELDKVFKLSGFKIERFGYSPGVCGRHLCYLLSKK